MIVFVAVNTNWSCHSARQKSGNYFLKVRDKSDNFLLSEKNSKFLLKVK